MSKSEEIPKVASIPPSEDAYGAPTRVGEAAYEQLAQSMSAPASEGALPVVTRGQERVHQPVPPAAPLASPPVTPPTTTATPAPAEVAAPERPRAGVPRQLVLAAFTFLVVFAIVYFLTRHP